MEHNNGEKMKKIKVLNLYAGIGGNRKLWRDCEVTAVELNPEIASIYQDFFPDDKVIVADAHNYLLEHYEDFDFIWTSPPCQSHTRMRHLSMVRGYKPKFPDMKLYEEIIFLKTWFKGKYVVENVIPYYKPYENPKIVDNHCFWTNFNIISSKKWDRGIRSKDLEVKQKDRGLDLSKYDVDSRLKRDMINNCVKDSVGLMIFECSQNQKQSFLNNFNKQLEDGKY